MTKEFISFSKGIILKVDMMVQLSSNSYTPMLQFNTLITTPREIST